MSVMLKIGEGRRWMCLAVLCHEFVTCRFGPAALRNTICDIPPLLTIMDVAAAEVRGLNTAFPNAPWDWNIDRNMNGSNVWLNVGKYSIHGAYGIYAGLYGFKWDLYGFIWV